MKCKYLHYEKPNKEINDKNEGREKEDTKPDTECPLQ